MNKRRILWAAVIVVFAAFLWRGFSAYEAKTTQMPLAGSAIPKWIDQLPFLKVVPGLETQSSSV